MMDFIKKVIAVVSITLAIALALFIVMNLIEFIRCLFSVIGLYISSDNLTLQDIIRMLTSK